MRLRLAAALLGLTASALLGCEESYGWRVVPIDVGEFAAADSALVAGVWIRCAAGAWRDYMPRIGCGGPSGVMASARLSTTDGSPMPAAVRIDRLWIVHDGETWTAEPRENPRVEGLSWFDSVARSGPKWPTGTLVDIFVVVRDDAGRSALFASRGQIILKAS